MLPPFIQHRSARMRAELRAELPATQILHSIHNKIIPHPPCCLEFSRDASRGDRHLLVVGSYELHEDNLKQDNTEATAQEKPAVKNDEQNAVKQNDSKGTAISSDQSPTKPKSNSGSINSQYRSGYVLLYALFNEELRLLHIKKCVAGVLDVRFSPHHPWILAAALSNGSVSLFKVNYPLVETSLLHMSTTPLFPPSTLVLSLAWHPRHADLLAVSLSTGTIAVLKFSLKKDEPPLTVIRGDRKLHDHGMSVWTVAFADPSRWIGNVGRNDVAVWSGGDDAIVRYSTTFADADTAVMDFEKVIEFQPLRRLHQYGITSILHLPLASHLNQHNLLLTGSYDEYVRLIDSQSATMLAGLRLGDGVWSLAFMKDYQGLNPPLGKPMRLLVVASCLDAGAQVLEVERGASGNWSIKLLARFEEHDSLVYRTDVQREWPRPRAPISTQTEFTCASISFYDKRLCIWKFVDEEERAKLAKMRGNWLRVVKKAVVGKKAIEGS